MRLGLIRNPASRGNARRAAAPPADAPFAEPQTPQELPQVLAEFAALGVELIAVAGGDGTMREVLSALPAAYGPATPILAVLAAGKTNVLARDLGANLTWESLRQGASRTFASRRPLEIRWLDGAHSPLRGFVFGAAAFVRGTRIAQRANRVGLFQAPSVAAALVSATARTFLGSARDPWRVGEPMSLALDDDEPRAGRRFILLASTLKRLPLGARPFGAGGQGDGMRYLDIDAPARRLSRMLGPVLDGRDHPELAALGYRRGRARRLRLSIDAPVIVDGEAYPGGEIEVRQGEPIRFVTTCTPN